MDRRFRMAAAGLAMAKRLRLPQFRQSAPVQGLTFPSIPPATRGFSAASLLDTYKEEGIGRGKDEMLRYKAAFSTTRVMSRETLFAGQRRFCTGNGFVPDLQPVISQLSFRNEENVLKESWIIPDEYITEAELPLDIVQLFEMCERYKYVDKCLITPPGRVSYLLKVDRILRQDIDYRGDNDEKKGRCELYEHIKQCPNIHAIDGTGLISPIDLTGEHGTGTEYFLFDFQYHQVQDLSETGKKLLRSGICLCTENLARGRNVTSLFREDNLWVSSTFGTFGFKSTDPMVEHWIVHSENMRAQFGIQTPNKKMGYWHNAGHCGRVMVIPQRDGVMHPYGPGRNVVPFVHNLDDVVELLQFKFPFYASAVLRSVLQLKMAEFYHKDSPTVTGQISSTSTTCHC